MVGRSLMMLKLSSKANMVGMRIRLSVAMVQIGYMDRIRFTDRISTPSWRIRLKACVDLSDQTAEFIPVEVIRMAILTYSYLF